MKKTILSMVILSQLFLGCKKPIQKPHTASPVPELKPQYSMSPGMTYYTYGTDIVESDFLDNPDDPADQQFNYVGHALTLGLLEVYNDNPALMNDLVQFVSETRNLQGNLFLFADEHPEINAIFNQVFATRFQDFGSASWQDYVNAHYRYDTQYTPFACIANKRNYVLTEYPFIASPFEISEEKFKDFDNDYPLWMKTSTSVLFSTLNRGNVQDIPNPIIYIGNSFPGDDNNNMHVMASPYERNVDLTGGYYTIDEPPMVPMSCNLSPLPAGHTHETISHVRYQINERYEGTGKSEYTVAWAFYRAHAAATNNWGPYGGPGIGNYKTSFQESRKVKKNEVGTTKDWYFDVYSPMLYKDQACFDIERMYSQSVWDYFFFAAFEEDDLVTAKLLGTVKDWTINAVSAPRKGKMKYANEWYFFEPTTNNRFQFTNYFPTPSSTYYNYTKGKVEMLRHY